MKKSKKKPKRIPISPETTKIVMALFRKSLAKAYEKHGKGACWSMHEAVGMVTEEYDELKKAMHENDLPEFVLEAIDVMIAGFWSASSAVEGVIDGKWDGDESREK